MKMNLKKRLKMLSVLKELTAHHSKTIKKDNELTPERERDRGSTLERGREKKSGRLKR